MGGDIYIVKTDVFSTANVTQPTGGVLFFLNFVPTGIWPHEDHYGQKTTS